VNLVSYEALRQLHERARSSKPFMRWAGGKQPFLARYSNRFPSLNGRYIDGTFSNIERARAYCRRFFAWYNAEHRHSGIALLTPEDVHRGRVYQRRQARRGVLQAAYAHNPQRFVNGTPEPPALEPNAFILVG